MRRPAAALLAVLFVLFGTSPVHAETRGAVAAFETIPGDGGTPLRAFVARPTGWGNGPFPLLVMPASWATPNLEYAGAAVKFARESGSVVISYTARGFYDSGGTIEVAGPQDISDAQQVINWGAAHAKADLSKVGMAGVSYGAGISLLTAAADKRVRAVAAMSTWTDLVKSLYPNETINQQASLGLIAAGRLTGRAGPDLQKVEQGVLKGDIKPGLAIAGSRSPINRIDQINANKPAVMLANAWDDGIFSPGQVVDFYNKLTVPKRLMLAPGDHTTPEILGAFGLPNDIMTAAGQWFDHYVRGVDNGIDRQPPVHLQPNTGGGWQSYPSWQAASATTQTHYLGRSGLLGSGRLAAAPETGWTTRINTGRNTVADSGLVILTGALVQFLQTPPTAYLPLVNRSDAAVWATEPYARGTSVTGSPQLHTTVTPSRPDTSLFAYLYDVGPDGRGTLVSHKPVSLRGATPGAAKPVDITLEPVSWQVPAGHHLALVVDTVDPRYRTASKAGTATFGSPAADPSWLRIPAVTR